MPVPKRRTSKARKNSRRANHDRVERPNLTKCSKCGEPKLPHRVCLSCGFYNGKEVIEMD